MLLRQALTGLSLYVASCFPNILSSLILLQATYFGSSTSDTEMDVSRSLVGHGSQYMGDSVPVCLLPEADAIFISKTAVKVGARQNDLNASFPTQHPLTAHPPQSYDSSDCAIRIISSRDH